MNIEESAKTLKQIATLELEINNLLSEGECSIDKLNNFSEYIKYDRANAIYSQARESEKLSHLFQQIATKLFRQHELIMFMQNSGGEI